MTDTELTAASALLAGLPTRLRFGAGTLDELGNEAKAEGARQVLLVTDPGITAAGYVDRALPSLNRAGVDAFVFDGVAENPTTDHAAAGLEVARMHGIDFIVALGGGSAMDCAKGINLLYSNGGQIADYWGIDKATKPLLPMIAVPTTAGTGSEAQSFALISDAATRRKMACGDRRPPREGGLRPRVAILDPDLTVTAPPRVTATAGIDAVAHAVETAATNARKPFSRRLSFAAWNLMTGGPPSTPPTAFETVLHDPHDDEARWRMLLGAHLAGAAIEQSMLGAAHACANPLTARHGIPHGAAVGLMLSHVVRFNSRDDNPYADLMPDAEPLARLLERFLDAARLPRGLGDYGIAESSLPELATLAAQEWTAAFNPRHVGAEDFLTMYRLAY